MQEAIQYFEAKAARVVEGYANALLTYAEISHTIKALQALEETIKEQAIRDAENEDKKFKMHGYTFEKLPPRRMVNYKNVPQWADLKARQERIEKLALTAATQFGITVVDDETGEIVPAAEIKYTKESLSVKFTK